MRGSDTRQEGLFSYLSPDQRVPKSHPLRPIRKMVDQSLEELSPKFSEIYSPMGRPSIAPEKLLRALLLQVLYSVRSERMLMEQLGYNLLFRWFVGLSMDEKVWVPTVFTKNRDRLLSGEITSAFFESILGQARAAHLLSDEHFTVDGTLLEAWASQKSFQPKDPSDEPPASKPGSFRGQKRSNKTHASKTDGQARLYRKSQGQEARLAYLGHALMDNRHGLIAEARVSQATGTAERDTALEMLGELPGNHRITLGADKGYDTRDFVTGARQLLATPHVTQNTSNRRSAIDGRTTRHVGYAMSQNRRPAVESIFGWIKNVGMLRKTRLRGLERIDPMFKIASTAYNLVRLRNLGAAQGAQ